MNDTNTSLAMRLGRYGRILGMVGVGALLLAACPEEDTPTAPDAAVVADILGDATTVDAAPDVTVADTAILDAAPDITPDVAVGDAVPDTIIPDAAPDATVPDTTTPDATVADTMKPDATVPTKGCSGTTTVDCLTIGASICPEAASVGCTPGTEFRCADDSDVNDLAPYDCEAYSGNPVFCTATTDVNSAGWFCTYLPSGQCATADGCANITDETTCEAGRKTSAGTVPCYWAKGCEGTIYNPCAPIPNKDACEYYEGCTWTD